MRITAPAADVPPNAAASHLIIEDVPAGRGFHWQSTRTQHFTGAIDILHDPRGLMVVNELRLEDYLAGVITAEMSSACPAKFLQAQCITARSWLLARGERKHEHEPFDRCNDDCCQRFQGETDISAEAARAVADTAGKVLLTPHGRVLDANYSKCCGGISETPRCVWGVDKPGLSSVVDASAESIARRFAPLREEQLAAFLLQDWHAGAGVYCSPSVVSPDDLRRFLGPVDVIDDYFRWTCQTTGRAMAENLRRTIPAAAHIDTIRDLRVLERGVSGRVLRLEIGGADENGESRSIVLGNQYDIRLGLHEKFLFSSALLMEFDRGVCGEVGQVTMHGAGWGHGVGLCQIGALGMALQGHDSTAILRHYFPQSRLTTAYACGR